MHLSSMPAGPVRSIQRGALFLLTASSFVAFVEPSPFEASFAILLIVFAATNGLHASATILPLATCLLFFVIGGVFCLFPYLSETSAVMFTSISAYLSVATIVFAMLLAEDAEGRLEALRKGYIFAGIAASIAGIMGYFDLFGLGTALTRFDRAAGTFKDANVLGPFVVLPCIYLIHRMFVERVRLFDAAALGLMLFGGVFLSFSRGAWGDLIASFILVTVLTWFANPTKRVRKRIFVLASIGFLAAVVGLMIALSFDSILEMFNQRAVLVQDYDGGSQGRFGKLLTAIPELLERPNGFGPLRLRFHTANAEDAHDVYVNAFASYGWLGGFSYVLLMLFTVVISYRIIRTRFPLRHHAIIIGLTLFVQILQGFQIDTDHWRHFWLMLGLMWGMIPAARAAERLQPSTRRKSASASALSAVSAARSAPG